MIWDALRFCRDFSIPYILPGESSSSKVTAGRLGVQCPNPNCDRNSEPDYGAFNIYGGYYSCWNCGGHKLNTVIKWFLKIGNHEAQSLMWDYSGTAIMSKALNHKKKKPGIKKIELPGGNLKMSHWNYLKSRNFDPEYIIDKYNLLGVGKKPNTMLEQQFRNRLIIPIYNKNGKLISYQGRDVSGKSKLRYKGCEIKKSVMNYKHTFYGWPFVKENKVAIVEGIFDQWAMGDGFLCSFGTAVTAFQIKELISTFDKVFILFDPENTAQQLADKTATKIASFNKEVEVIKLDTDKDPGDLSEIDRKYIRRELGFV